MALVAKEIEAGTSPAAFSALLFSKGIIATRPRPEMHGMMIPDRMVVTPASRPRRAALGDQMARRTPGRIQPPGCPLRSVAMATGFMQMLRASSNRAAGCCIQGTRADTLIVRRQPNTTGRTGSPILQGIGQQIMPSHGGKRVGNSQENRPGQGSPDTGMGRAAELGASGLHGAHPHTIRRSGHVHAPRHAPSRRVSSERGRP
jgi:hypothetical protein